jgi:hypothetical protein
MVERIWKRDKEISNINKKFKYTIILNKIIVIIIYNIIVSVVTWILANLAHTTRLGHAIKGGSPWYSSVATLFMRDHGRSGPTCLVIMGANGQACQENLVAKSYTFLDLVLWAFIFYSGKLSIVTICVFKGFWSVF